MCVVRGQTMTLKEFRQISIALDAMFSHNFNGIEFISRNNVSCILRRFIDTYDPITDKVMEEKQ